MRIRQLTIRSYKGIEEKSVPVGEHGAVVVGRNGSGKTSILDAVRAALAGRNVGPDAIRLGADRAEILVDLEDIEVRRVIDGGGTRVELRPEQKKPAAFLARLLGAGQLDPVELLTERDATKRRARILGALPMRVTAEQLRELVPGVEPGDCSGHALEVVSRLGKEYEERRRVANAEARDCRGAAERARQELGQLPAGTLAPGARTELDAARRARAVLEARAADAVAAQSRSAATRDKVSELEAAAADRREWAPAVDEVLEGLAADALAKATANVGRLEAELEQARLRLGVTEAQVATRAAARRQREAALAEAARLEEQAATLRQALGAGAVDGPSDAALAEAAQLEEQAARRLAAHEAAERRQATEDAWKATDARAREAEAAATALDRVVRALRSDVPAELIRQSGAIPGLGVEGDRVTLDGVDLDQLNDAGRLRLAVQIAKRATPEVRVLVTDRLELLDPEQYAAFVAEAIADGWQLIGARVAGGDVRVEAIDAGEDWS